MALKNYSLPAKHKGFTLIELIAVVTILAILGTIVTVNIMGSLASARIQTAKTNIQTLENGLKTYKMTTGRFPSTEQGLQALVTKPVIEPVPKNWRASIEGKLPSDPWGNDFQYLYPGNHDGYDYDLFSYGADGQPGGDDDNADIGNWDL